MTQDTKAAKVASDTLVAVAANITLTVTLWGTICPCALYVDEKNQRPEQ